MIVKKMKQRTLLFSLCLMGGVACFLPVKADPETPAYIHTCVTVVSAPGSVKTSCEFIGNFCGSASQCPKP